MEADTVNPLYTDTQYNDKICFFTYQAVKYRDFSVILYNSLCNKIAVTSELFQSTRTVFYRLLPALLQLMLTFSAAKRDQMIEVTMMS